MSESRNNRRQSTQALLNNENELILFCDSATISEEGIREIIERRGLAANNNRIRKYKSFPAACKNKRVTEGIIRCLLEFFPDAINLTNEQGWLPLHWACYNINATLEMIQLLVDAAPDSVRSVTNNKGSTPLHKLCCNKTIDEANAVQILKLLIEECPEVVRHADNDGELPIHLASGRRSPEFCRVLFEAYPGSVRSATNNGNMPLHCLCRNMRVDEAAAIQLLNFLLEKCPEAVRHANNKGHLPIHLAAGKAKSAHFCRVLIEAHPGSERITTNNGALPFHCACSYNSLATVDYLYKVYPDAIHHTNAQGHYPIHGAIQGMKRRDYRRGLSPIYALEIVLFLLDCDANQKIIKVRGKSLLQCACEGTYYSKASIEAGIQIIKVIFDAHPEAIEDERIATNVNLYHQQVQSFINEHLVLARHAKDHRLMTTPDDNGRLPLHRALQYNAMLGLIKLLVKGNPAAVLSRDISGALPVHIACQHHDSAIVVQYLIGLNASVLDAVDRQGNTALHHACRGAKHNTIMMLLKEFDATSVSKRNAHGKLPVDLLWESNAVEDRESVEYTGSVFQLVRAYPEMTMISNTT